MPSRDLRMPLVALLVILVACEDVCGESKLHSVLMKRREAPEEQKPGGLQLTPAEAREFLSPVRRPKRNVWDRSRPDVQQWIMQYRYMGFDETRLEADLSYWWDYYRSIDRGRQHHYDENSPLAPQHRSSHRHGADVNYDYY
uniref:ECRG4 augurin precursor a n=1 Tax=Paramormyrops kingsleyae TaxID=1676925 RepID=A0A3B3SGF2_9TELE|nr:augurin [Paramormyrops kingsleyae]